MKILSLYKKDAVTRDVEPVAELELVPGFGIAGDGNAREGSFRQVLLASKPHIDAFGIEDAVFKPNIIVDGIIEDWPSGTAVRTSCGIELRLVYACEPCFQLDEQVPGLSKKVHGRRGRLAVVTGGGILRIGDELTSVFHAFPVIPEDVFERVGYFVRQVPAGKVVTFEILRLACGLNKANMRVMPLYLKRNLGKAPVHRVVTSSGALIEQHFPGQCAFLQDEGVSMSGDAVPSLHHVFLTDLV